VVGQPCIDCNVQAGCRVGHTSVWHLVVGHTREFTPQMTSRLPVGQNTVAPPLTLFMSNLDMVSFLRPSLPFKFTFFMILDLKFLLTLISDFQHTRA
jgi:hypothetical protein